MKKKLITKPRSKKIAVSSLIIGIVLVVIANILIQPTTPGPCEDCNVVIIIVDTLRADHLGVFGYEKNTSPNIDAFAKQAKAYNNAMSQSGATVYSIPSILTGKYPFSDNILEDITHKNITYPRRKLREKETTIAELLQREKYTTIGVTAMTNAKAIIGHGQGFTLYDDNLTYGEQANITFAKAIQHIKTINPEKLFLWIHIRPPHMPYNVSEELFLQFYTPKDNEPTFKGVQTSEKEEELLAHFSQTEPIIVLHEEKNWTITPTMLQQMRAMYDASIHQMDMHVQELFTFLEEYYGKEEFYNNTIIIIAADHGEILGTRDWYGHSRVYYEAVHTPIILYYPGVQPEVNNKPVMNVDILPTILDLVGINYHSKYLRGTNLLTPQPMNRTQYAELLHDQEFTIKQGDYKYMLTYNGEFLYNIQQDPQELHDIKRDNIELFHQLREEAKQIIKNEIGSITLEELKSLGYI